VRDSTTRVSAVRALVKREWSSSYGRGFALKGLVQRLVDKPERG